MNGKALASMAVVAILLVTAVCIVPPSDATGDTDVLLDHGNGSVEWTQSSGGTVEDVLADAMIGLGVDFEISSGTISVDGVSSKTVGSSSNGGSLEESGATGATVTTEWHVFLWDGSSWVETDELSAPADASAVALAFYPDGISPVVTPDHPYAVTMSRGDSSNTGNFDADYSSGEEYEVTWSETGTAHANILYATSSTPEDTYSRSTASTPQARQGSCASTGRPGSMYGISSSPAAPTTSRPPLSSSATGSTSRP